MGQRVSREDENIERAAKAGKGGGFFGWLYSKKSPNAGDKRGRDDSEHDLESSLPRAKKPKGALVATDFEPVLKPPLASYLAFSIERRPDMRREYPDARNGELSVMIGEEWRRSPELRQKYKIRQDKLKAEYEAKMAQLGLPIPIRKRNKKKEKEMNRNQENEAKSQTNERKPAGNGKPKHPKSAYLLFAKDNRSIVKQEHPNAPSTEITRILSERWKFTPVNIRRKYFDSSCILRETYREEMAIWRANQKRDEGAQAAANPGNTGTESNSDQKLPVKPGPSPQKKLAKQPGGTASPPPIPPVQPTAITAALKDPSKQPTKKVSSQKSPAKNSTKGTSSVLSTKQPASSAQKGEPKIASKGTPVTSGAGQVAPSSAGVPAILPQQSYPAVVPPFRYPYGYAYQGAYNPFNVAPPQYHGAPNSVLPFPPSRTTRESRSPAASTAVPGRASDKKNKTSKV